MRRINVRDLERLVLTINELTESPTEYWTDKLINIGHYTLSGAYGGWQLQRVMNTSGGVDLPLGETGHIPKRELYDLMHAYIRGIDLENLNRMAQ